MKLRFKGLTELRGIAALMVFFSHLELLKHNEKIQSTLYNTAFSGFIHSLGKSGVYLFFVLSGFLITSLLLTEIEKTGSIQLKKFYIRRTLRIWPLYYLIVLLYFFVVPNFASIFQEYSNSEAMKRVVSGEANFWKQFVLYIMFLPNLASVVFTNPKALASFCWSIGVEEQFYLFWPFLLLLFRVNSIAAMCAVPITKLVVYLSLLYVLPHIYYHEYFKHLINFLRSFNIELMAFGGILAYMVKQGFSFADRFNKIHSALTVILIVICLYYEVNYLITGVLFVFLIGLSINDKSNIFSNSKLEWVGEVSYGLYMFHPLSQLITYVAIEQMTILPNENPVIFNLLLIPISLLLSFLISGLSYKYLESPLLELKERYAVVHSGKS